jgi:hypothetical protein
LTLVFEPRYRAHMLGGAFHQRRVSRPVHFTWPGWSVLLLLLFAQGSAQVHMLVGHHHVCPAHGEVVDGDARQPHGDSHDVAHSLSAGQPPVPDHHCAVAAHLLRSARTANPVALAVARVPALAPPARSLAADDQQISILSFAPKHSPPIA